MPSKFKDFFCYWEEQNGYKVSGMSEAVVYILGPESRDKVKVGHSGINAYTRAYDMQTGCWEDLVVWHELPFLSKRAAYMVEKRTHNSLLKAGIPRFSRREWFETNPEVALDHVIRACREAWADCADNGKDLELVSATPLDNLFFQHC